MDSLRFALHFPKLAQTHHNESTQAVLLAAKAAPARLSLSTWLALPLVSSLALPVKAIGRDSDVDIKSHLHSLEVGMWIGTPVVKAAPARSQGRRQPRGSCQGTATLVLAGGARAHSPAPCVAASSCSLQTLFAAVPSPSASQRHTRISTDGLA